MNPFSGHYKKNEVWPSLSQERVGKKSMKTVYHFFGQQAIILLDLPSPMEENTKEKKRLPSSQNPITFRSLEGKNTFRTGRGSPPKRQRPEQTGEKDWQGRSVFELPTGLDKTDWPKS
ncbi:MAG: hypothetical protein AB1585_03735 [Thermodesulfobacteriota bacterium]